MRAGRKVTGAVDTSLARTSSDLGDLQGRGASLTLFLGKCKELLCAHDVESAGDRPRCEASEQKTGCGSRFLFWDAPQLYRSVWRNNFAYPVPNLLRQQRTLPCLGIRIRLGE